MFWFRAKIKQLQTRIAPQQPQNAMDKQPFIDRILETENLTDELEDDDAKWLLNWGVANLEPVLAGESDPEKAGDKVNALMAVMRKINRISAVYAQKPAPDLVQDLTNLQELIANAFGRPAALSVDQLQAFADRLGKLPVRQAIETLTQLDKV